MEDMPFIWVPSIDSLKGAGNQRPFLNQAELLEVKNACALPPELNHTHEKVWEFEQTDGETN